MPFSFKFTFYLLLLIISLIPSTAFWNVISQFLVSVIGVSFSCLHCLTIGSCKNPGSQISSRLSWGGWLLPCSDECWRQWSGSSALGPSDVICLQPLFLSKSLASARSLATVAHVSQFAHILWYLVLQKMLLINCLLHLYYCSISMKIHILIMKV